MITAFKLSQNGKTVSWRYDGETKILQFTYPVNANQVTLLDEVLVQSDVRENGEQNLLLYHADGSLKARPAMPKLKHKVHGVYAVWFVPDEIELTVVLLSDEHKPYDTACTVNLKTHRFSNFHPTN